MDPAHLDRDPVADLVTEAELRLEQHARDEVGPDIIGHAIAFAVFVLESAALACLLLPRLPDAAQNDEG